MTEAKESKNASRPYSSCDDLTFCFLVFKWGWAYLREILWRIIYARFWKMGNAYAHTQNSSTRYVFQQPIDFFKLLLFWFLFSPLIKKFLLWKSILVVLIILVNEFTGLFFWNGYLILIRNKSYWLK